MPILKKLLQKINFCHSPLFESFALLSIQNFLVCQLYFPPYQQSPSRNVCLQDRKLRLYFGHSFRALYDKTYFHNNFRHFWIAKIWNVLENIAAKIDHKCYIIHLVFNETVKTSTCRKIGHQWFTSFYLVFRNSTQLMLVMGGISLSVCKLMSQMSWPFADNYITKQKNNLRISWILSDHATFGRIVGVPFGKAINDSIESANQSIVPSIQTATSIYCPGCRTLQNSKLF